MCTICFKNHLTLIQINDINQLLKSELWIHLVACALENEILFHLGLKINKLSRNELQVEGHENSGL